MLALVSVARAEATDPDPERALGEQLSALGAPSLALDYFEARQPDIGLRPLDWARFERAILERLHHLGDWHALLERRAGYPQAVPDDVRVLADELAIEASLRLGDGDAARAAADQLLAHGPLGTGERARWWQLRIRADLATGRPDEARTALLGYRGEFPDDQAGWAPLDARLLLLDGHFEEAVLGLSGMTGPEVELIRLAAVAAAGGRDAERFREAASGLLDGEEATPVERYQAWVMTGRVAARANALGLRARAFERAVATLGREQPPGLLAEVTPDELWTAYLEHAQHVGNQARLLVGRHDDWLALAVRLGDEDPLAARAVHAFLAVGEAPRGVREAAGAALARAAWADEGLRRVQTALWLGAKRIDSLDRIPSAVRPLLVVDLVAQGRYEAAGALVPEPFAVPAIGAPAPPWLADYGHALVRAGARREGVAVLVSAAGRPDLEPAAWWGATVRAVHDLLDQGQPEQAIELLAAVAPTAGPDLQPAIAMLGADAASAAGRHRTAARAYLEAAAGLDELDPGRALARLLAARALERAGLGRDAEGVLRALAETLPEDSLAARLAAARRR